ncbi:hypothetical protein LC653_43285 [Nostoc sp. CHAB 5784]|uniref:formyltransferase family protein n=1 Tax=Nostoc mirabile TaxID=2907820 RepID=UPI001E54552B|nr:formyltransferase family protein [Nostoc mirabile]MCC5670427.1 hypothetical protein [Nostoc mirabile CHAB5784]
MRLVIFANGTVGYAALAATLENIRAEVVAVCIASDGNIESNYLIRQLAAERPCIELTKNVSYMALDELASLNIDLIVLAWWPYILKSNLLTLPRIGCLNFHPGFLPYCRGMDPNFWSLIEQSPFGVTLHFADTSVDGGDIVFQTEIPVTWEDTGQTLLDRAKHELVQLYKEHLDEILSGSLTRRPQPPGGNPHRRSQLDPASQIHLDKSTTARQLLNLLRARMFPPQPEAAWFIGDDGERYEVRIFIKRQLQ